MIGTASWTIGSKLFLHFQSKRELIPFAFLPCVEPANYANAFITKHPAELIANGEIASDVPYITGINQMEGLIMLKCKFPLDFCSRRRIKYEVS